MKSPAEKIQEWTRSYRGVQPAYDRFATKLKILMEDLLGTRQIKYQVVEARGKTVASFTDKLQREGKSYTDPLKEITDFAGNRIILYYAEDVALVSDLIDSEFQVDKLRSVDKRAVLAPDQFGYLSVHKIISLSRRRGRLPEWSNFSKLVAEIQIRSVLQHSWAAISHALQYKHESDVPAQFRRRLIRISGLLELADQEFGALRNEQIDFSRVVSESVSKGNLNLGIDAVSAGEFANKSKVVSDLMRKALKHGLLESDDSGPEDLGVSQMSQVAAILDLRTIAQLEEILASAGPKADVFFEIFRKPRLERATRVSPAHVAAMLLVATRGRNLSPEQQARIGWHSDYMADVVAAGKAAYSAKA